MGENVAAQQAKSEIISQAGKPTESGSFEARAQSYADTNYPVPGRTKATTIGKIDQDAVEAKKKEFAEVLKPEEGQQPKQSFKTPSTTRGGSVIVGDPPEGNLEDLLFTTHEGTEISNLREKPLGEDPTETARAQ